MMLIFRVQGQRVPATFYAMFNLAMAGWAFLGGLLGAVVAAHYGFDIIPAAGIGQVAWELIGWVYGRTR